jgi:hypothetical protein
MHVGDGCGAGLEVRDDRVRQCRGVPGDRTLDAEADTVTGMRCVSGGRLRSLGDQRREGAG